MSVFSISSLWYSYTICFHGGRMGKRYMKVWVEAVATQSCPTICNPMDCSPPAPLSMGFSRQEYWNGLLCLPPEDLPDPGIEPTCLTSPALAGRLITTSATWEAHGCPQACRKQGLGVGDPQKDWGQASPHAQAGGRACSLPPDRVGCWIPPPQSESTPKPHGGLPRARNE